MDRYSPDSCFRGLFYAHASIMMMRLFSFSDSIVNMNEGASQSDFVIER